MAKDNLGNLLELCATHKLDNNFFLELLSILMNQYKDVEHSFFYLDRGKTKLLATSIEDMDEKKCLLTMVKEQADEQKNLDIRELSEKRTRVKGCTCIPLLYFTEYIGLWIMESYLTETVFIPHTMQMIQYFYGILIGSYALHQKEQRSYYLDPATHCPGRMYFKLVFDAMEESKKEKINVCAFQLCATDSVEVMFGSEFMDAQIITFVEKLNALGFGNVYRVTDSIFVVLSATDIVDLYDTVTIFLKEAEVDVKSVIFNSVEADDIFKELIVKFSTCKQQEIKI